MTTITEDFLIAGTFDWVCPSNVFEIRVECYGGGGAGSGILSDTGTRAGGAGGQYALKIALSVIPETHYTLVVAAVRTGTTGNASNGNDTTFGTTLVVAKGGASAVGNNPGVGATTGGIGDTIYKGGNGAGGSAGAGSGGGGGGAGYISNGSNGSVPTGGTNGGGLAGNGGYGHTTPGDFAGHTGGDAGGGGGGAYRESAGSSTGGNGTIGAIRLIYTPRSINKHFFVL